MTGPDEPKDLESPPVAVPAHDWSQPRRPEPPAPGPATVMDHMIPTKNPPALIGYYIGVFSLIPCAGLLLGPAAVVIGLKGLKEIKKNPALPGKGHAVTAIVLGSVSTLANWGVIVWVVLNWMPDVKR